eukprot:gene32128-36936_t
MTSEYINNVVVVTGGASGIGKATAELMLSYGAKVCVLDVNIGGAPSDADAYVADVTNDEAIVSVLGKIGAKYGRIDSLVNSAGVSFYGGVEDGSLDDWRRLLDINVLGVVRTTRAALPHLRESKHGSIGAVEALSRSMAADLVKENIRVNCVNPGTVDTAFIDGLVSTSGRDRSEFAA